MSIFTAPAGAQPAHVLAPGSELTQYVHDVWRTEQGLPQNTVRALANTADGYLWLGTEEGLVRYDGVHFSVFDKKTTPAFQTSHAIQTLLSTRDGALWIGTENGGLLRYEEGRFIRYGEVAAHTSEAVSALVAGKGGALWIGTRGGGLFYLKQGQISVYNTSTHPGLVSNHINTLHYGKDGTLWIGTSAGLSTWSASAFEPVPDVAGAVEPFVLAIQRDREGVLWIGTRNGLFQVRDSILHGVPGWENKSIRTLDTDSLGALWVGMDSGGVRRLYEGRTDTFSTAEGLSHDRVLALYHDPEGSLWIGTEGGGLNRLWDSAFTWYTTQEQLSHDMVLSVFEDHEGSLWIGTEGGGVNRLRDGQISTLTTADGLPSNLVTTINGQPDGTLWIGTIGPGGGGLSRLRDGKITTFRSTDGLPSDQVYVVYADRDGGLWIGTDAGLTYFSDGQFTTYDRDDGLGSDFITSIYQARDGSLWIGTYDAGLTHFSDGQFTTYDRDDGLGSDIVLTLYEDADGTIWAGTYEGGLSRVRDGQITTFTMRDGLFSDIIFALLEDGAGHFWMSCNKGLFSIPRNDLEAFAAGRLDRLQSEAFTHSSGLKNAEFNGGTQPAAWAGHDGSLWFASVEGIVGFKPSDLLEPVPPPLPLLESVLIDREFTTSPDSLELRPGRRTIAFRYAAPQFIEPDKLRYQYMLEGYDEEWVEAEAGNEAVYMNLDPGRYKFFVRTGYRDGTWKRTSAAFPLYIRPFFYQTYWFWALTVGGLLLLGLLIYRFRIAQLKAREATLEHLVEERTSSLRTAKEQIEAQAGELRELNRFKSHFFANVSHEFRTPLTMIIGPLENALQGAYGPLTEPVRRNAEVMLRNALRLMRLINQLLDLAKLESSKMTLQARSRDVISFLEGVTLSFYAFAEQKNLDLTFNSTEPNLALYFEPDKLEKVFYNLLSNAVKFTPEGGAITINVSRTPPLPDMPEGSVRIEVQDTGPGIYAADLPHIFDRFQRGSNELATAHEGTGIGLSLAKELILLHHGTIDVESEPGVGTTFIIALPLGAAHLSEENLAVGDEEEVEPEHGAMTELAFSALGFMPPAAAEELNGQHTEGEDRPRVLVVEDNSDVREYIYSMLAPHYTVETACDGQEGLERTRSWNPDLVLSDVMMPRMNGYELVQAIKADEALCRIPVVLLTARTVQQLKVQSIEAGADDFLEKPFSARELLARVNNLIKQYRQARDLEALNAALEAEVEKQVQTFMHERQQYEQQLVAAKEEAERSSRLKSSILDNMNHEFRTPLAAIQGYAQLLAKEVQGPLQEFTTYIDENGKRLMRTLETVHQLSRLESGSEVVHLEAVDLVATARAARERFLDRARAKNLGLRVMAPGTEAIGAELDPRVLEQILDHLLDNAVKFTEEGEVRIVVAQDEKRVRLAVQDTGRGITPEFEAHMFEAFTQESTGLTRTHDGSGLGLALTKRLVSLLDGRLEYATHPNVGSTFEVVFPKLQCDVTQPVPFPSESLKVL